MFNGRRAAILALGCILGLSACGGRKSGSEPAAADAGGGKVLNLYIWSDYLAPNTLADFEKQTGIKVHVAYYDANGHYARVSSTFDDFKLGEKNTLTPVTPQQGLEGLKTGQLRRCPGGATQPAADGSSPFTDEGKLSCDPSEAP